MKKIILSLILLCFLVSCGDNSIEKSENIETTTTNQTKQVEEENRAILERDGIKILWNPKVYNNEEFKKIAKQDMTADKLMFEVLYANIKSAPEEYNDKVSFVFINIGYPENTRDLVILQAVSNITDQTIKNIKFDLMVEDKNTGERYLEVRGAEFDSDLEIDIPPSTVYFYPVGVTTSVERIVGTKLGQNDVNVYVENLTYDIVE